MKILLTGCSGQLGNEIIKAKPKNFELICLNRSKLNLENNEECLNTIYKLKPHWIINSAAFTNVDDAETNKKIAFQINTEAPKYFAKAIKKVGGKILQISSDYVFDGNKKTPYKVNDQMNPQTIYGESKFLAEKSISELLDKSNQYLILRTSWLMGPTGNNFLLTMLRLHKTKREIKVVADQVGSMTSTLNLSKVVWELIQKTNDRDEKNINYPKVHHWNDEGSITWHELAVEIGEIATKIGLIDKPARVIPIKTSEYKFSTFRPKYSVLDCKSTEEFINLSKRYWKNSLFDILSKINH